MGYVFKCIIGLKLRRSHLFIVIKSVSARQLHRSYLLFVVLIDTGGSIGAWVSRLLDYLQTGSSCGA